MNLYEENCLLKERIIQLETVLGAVPAPLALGLTQSQGRIFSVLMRRQMATKEQLIAAVYTDFGREPPVYDTIHVFIVKIRKKLKKLGIRIRTIPQHGYAIDADQKKKLISILESPIP